MADDRAPTPPPLMGFEALADRIEYIHSEHKGAKSEQSTINILIDKRVSRLEFLGEQTGERLNGGAATFAKLEGQIEKVNAKIEGPIWHTVMKVVGFAAPSVLFAIHLTWQAAHYPDENKFESLQNEVMEQKLSLVKLDAKLSNIETSSQIQAQLSTETNKKLDAMLLGNQRQLTAPPPAGVP
jgi:hypothetical protein